MRRRPHFLITGQTGPNRVRHLDLLHSILNKQSDASVPYIPKLYPRPLELKPLFDVVSPFLAYEFENTRYTCLYYSFGNRPLPYSIQTG